MCFLVLFKTHLIILYAFPIQTAKFSSGGLLKESRNNLLRFTGVNLLLIVALLTLDWVGDY